LAAAEKIDLVEIRWPSGKVDTLRNLAADRFYAVLEGEGIVPAQRIYPTVQEHPGADKASASPR
jgi:hypothetical protein